MKTNWRSCVVVAAGVLPWLTGCGGPLARSLEEELHERLLATNRAYIEAMAPGATIRVTQPVSSVEAELDDQRRKELDQISGPSAYSQMTPDLGPDLTGRTDVNTVQMTLQEAVQQTIQNNLTLQIARLVPAVDDTLVTQAEAVFDATYFMNLDWQKLDTPQPSTTPGLNVFGNTQQETTRFDVGIRKPLTTGGQVTVQTGITRNYRDPSFYNVNSFREASVLLNVTQPLLRNFGSDVNRAQIMLAGNSRRESIEDLRRQLMEACLGSEQAYWELVYARKRLVIQQRLLERTIKDRDQIKLRSMLDAAPPAITEANSFVEARRAELIRAQQDVRNASDTLKRLLNLSRLPVSDETLITPLDEPTDTAIQFNLLDAVTTALRQRPELRRALLEINDASVRQRVADNQRLPLLNLSASIEYSGIGDNIDEAYSALGEGKFIDYLLSMQFEAPIGNRAAEALVRQRQIERQAAVINYQNQAQAVVLDIKAALRTLITSYRLISAERASRRAAADNLRALEAQEAAGAALTPEFLDLKLRRQEAMAEAEIREMRAMVDYNIGIASFYLAMGTLLERNSIEFQDPLADRVVD